MAIEPANTFSTFDAVGNREDLSDAIYDISPVETPIMSSIGRTTASAVLHEWQTDALAAASSSNAVKEGADATTDAVTPTVRLSNTCQIMDKVSRVTGTQQVVSKAGRKNELSYQIAKNGKELKRDMEATITAAQAEAAGDVSTARTLGALPAWVITNDDFGTGGASGTGLGNTARTDGTQRAFTEAQVKTVLAAAWTAGGDPDTIYVGAFNKQKFSTFTGNATRYKTAEDSKLNASIDLYDSDFGELEVIPNRFQRSRDCWILQNDMWALAFLRSFKSYDLAKTGDSERKQLLVEFTLEARNEAASGGVFDLTTS